MTATARQWKTSAGAKTRSSILHAAVDIASQEGLEGLSLSRLADELSMSKSGLFAHFSSKEDLQLATVDAARELFANAVLPKTMAAEEGLPRLLALCDAWLHYASDSRLRGGCFFAAVTSEFDGRPGLVRDRITAVMREWLAGLEGAIADAQRLGQLDRKADATQLAFELNALELGANWAHELFGDRHATDRARTAIHARLASLRTPASGHREKSARPQPARSRRKVSKG